MGIGIKVAIAAILFSIISGGYFFIKEIAEPELAACGTNPPYAIFCDSLEVAGENWTPNLLTEFKNRRGYDLKPLLPALFGDFGPKTLDIRQDWGQTERRPPPFSVMPTATCRKARAASGKVSPPRAGRHRPATYSASR